MKTRFRAWRGKCAHDSHRNIGRLDMENIFDRLNNVCRWKTRLFSQLIPGWHAPKDVLLIRVAGQTPKSYNSTHLCTTFTLALRSGFSYNAVSTTSIPHYEAHRLTQVI